MLVLGSLKHPVPGNEGNWFSLETVDDQWGGFRVVIYRPDDTLIASGLFRDWLEASIFLLGNRDT